VRGHPLAAGRAQDRERPPAKDRRSTTEPTPPTEWRESVREFQIVAAAAQKEQKPKV